MQVETYSPTQFSSDDIYLSGVVSAKQTAVISTRMMGFVRKVYVKQGDRVKQGQLLIVINSDDLNAKKAQAQAMITEAEAAAKNAQRDYERFPEIAYPKKCFGQGTGKYGIEQHFHAIKVKIARQMLNEVNAMLAYTHITAPFRESSLKR